jgi:hypothetical protein
MNKFVYEYWSRTELGRKMIASDSVSDSDLLFMIPNNVKRMHGLPASRTYGKRKSIIKKNRKHRISSFRLFDLMCEIIEETLPKTYNNEWFDKFVDVKGVEIGEKNVFQPDFRLDTTVRTSIRPIMPFNSIG